MSKSKAEKSDVFCVEGETKNWSNEGGVTHRNPVHVAKDVADVCGNINPLMQRLHGRTYTCSVPLYVPNRLAIMTRESASVSFAPRNQLCNGINVDSHLQNVNRATLQSPQKSNWPNINSKILSNELQVHDGNKILEQKGIANNVIRRRQNRELHSLEEYNQPNYRDTDLKLLLTSNTINDWTTSSTLLLKSSHEYKETNHSLENELTTHNNQKVEEVKPRDLKRQVINYSKSKSNNNNKNGKESFEERSLKNNENTENFAANNNVITKESPYESEYRMRTTRLDETRREIVRGNSIHNNIIPNVNSESRSERGNKTLFAQIHELSSHHLPSFNKATSNSPNEFVYMMQSSRQLCDAFNPYNLNVVTHRQINKDDYYTVSQAGITHFKHNNASFKHRETWERECAIFHAIREIPVFKEYRKWHSFLIWRNFVRRQRMNASRENLRNNLFHAHPNLAETLLYVHTSCLQFESTHNLFVNTTSTNTLEEYCRILREHLDKERTKLEKMVVSIRGKVEQACKVAMLSAQLEREKANVLRVCHNEKTRKKIIDVKQLGVQQQQPSYIEMTQRKATCRRLTSFITLCDHIIISYLTSLAFKAVKCLRDSFALSASSLSHENLISVEEHQLTISGDENNHFAYSNEVSKAKRLTEGANIIKDNIINNNSNNNNSNIIANQNNPGSCADMKECDNICNIENAFLAKKMSVSESDCKKNLSKESDASANELFIGPLIKLEVKFNNKLEDNEIIPTAAKVFYCVDEVIECYLRAVYSIPRLTSMDVFKVYTDEVELSEGPDVREMIIRERQYEDNVNEIHKILNYNFKIVERYVREFDVYRDMFLTNKSLNREKILSSTETMDFFREQLHLYKCEMDDIANKIPDSKNVGCIKVFTETLRDFLSPSPVTCINIFYDVMPVIAHRENEKLLSILQRQNTYLASTPKTIEHFVEYMEYFKNLEAEFDNIAIAHDFVRELFTLLQEEKVNIGDDDEETYRNGTRPQFDKLRNTIQAIEDGRESQQRFFTRNIDAQMEELRRNIEAVYDKAGQPIVMNGTSEIHEVIKYVTELQAKAEEIAAREKELRTFQLAIGAEETTVDILTDMLSDVNLKVKLWSGIEQWDEFTSATRDVAFNELDISHIVDVVNRYVALVKQVSGKLNNNTAVPVLRNKVEVWRQLMPILQALVNPKMKLEHHTKVSSVIGKLEDENKVSKTLSEWGVQFTIGLLLNNDVARFRDDILAISIAATEEDKLQQQIDKVNAMWNGGGVKPAMEFQFHNHKDIKDVYTLVGTGVEDVNALLEDSVIAISTVGASKYCHGVLRTQVDRWENRLKYMQETLDNWIELQRNWIYLENIFASAEIRSQWKDDAKRFEKVDRFYRDLMRKAHELPTAFRALLINAPLFDTSDTSTKTLKSELEGYIKELEKVLLSMEKKLEEKRRAFPRFYFLSNDDLLDILAKVKTPQLMMCHMLKMFDGIKTLSINTDTNDITHLVSIEGEKVELTNRSIKARGPVETWMDLLEREVFNTLRVRAELCIQDYERQHNRATWMFSHAVQLVLITEQLLWTRSVEEILDTDDASKRMIELRRASYDDLTNLATLTAQTLTKVERILLSTMITIDVHGRDLIDEMCESEVTQTRDFGWAKQLRVYWEKAEDGQGNLFIRQNNSCFVYGYEYLGAQGRLVITPLTDRIYMTITGALKLHLGAAPAGPAGTGKTETVKDLAKNLARQCIVYNCSDGVTYKMMEKFFSGLIQSGAWACLDEFNRINIEVLSVIASQLLEIKLALQNEKEVFTFQGTCDVRVRRTYGAFITMNPGYAGRTELPDNLKILFRPVAVMTPDFRMIAEVILYSEGFKNAKELSLKITQLYKLSSEQLSPQDHYDFGMRALKSILVMAGDLKRSQPDVDEDLTLIIACNDANVPKFVAEDVPLFHGIMQDLFPGISFPKRGYDELRAAMNTAMQRKHLVEIATWVTKGIQLFETLIVRHGVMMVGVTGTGKTESRVCIGNALEVMYHNHSTHPMARPVHEYVINPKSVLLHELYGKLDVNTNEWKDGVLAAITKECVRLSENGQDHQWIVFDGPVDTLWIESLNSVLDDSKLLCLDNGERIKLPDTIHMLFEVADLAVASPATVSRCGMVYVDVSDLPWRAIVRQWLDSVLAPFGASVLCQRYVYNLFDRYVDDGLSWQKEQNPLIYAADINMVQSMCNLFASLLTENNITLSPDPSDVKMEHTPNETIFRERNEMCNAVFFFAFVWSIGGNVDQSAMDNFDSLVRASMETLLPIPHRGTVYDYTINFHTRLLVSWETKMAPFEYNPSLPYFDILVPTVDTIRYISIARTLLSSAKPFLFTGQTGVGKSVIMSECLRQHQNELALSLITFQFSAQTSSSRTQELIETKLKHKRKNILGAPPGRRVVLFIDDLNMPALEVFGASPPIELLRQLMGNGGFYDRKVAGFWKYVEDVMVVAACGPPEGGRNHLTPRLSRLFHLLQIPTLTDDSMRRIFGSIVHGFLHSRNFSKEVKDISSTIVSVSVDIYSKLKDALRPRPATPHYTFNLRDLAKVFQGLTQVIPRVCRDHRAITHLWIHECMRCFYDRLATGEERQFFIEELMADAIARVSPASHDSITALFTNDPIIWGDFLRIGATERVYEEAIDFTRLPNLFNSYQEDYNAMLTNTTTTTTSGTAVNANANTNTDNNSSSNSTYSSQSALNLVFFNDHCVHLSRIIRILRQPRGNALLVGVGGSGKRSLTRLAAYVAECRLFQIAVGKGYSMNEFHEFLLEVYTHAGVRGGASVVILSDDQIVHEAMLEDVNNMLNSGEVPSLFNLEEREKRINGCLELAQQRGINNRDDVFNFFISRVRDNMHVVLCMSPVGDAFRTRCRQFPSLTNCCTIDWFDEWPSDALIGVAGRLLEELRDTLPESFCNKLPELCVRLHLEVVSLSHSYWDELRRQYYVTPTSYLEFIEIYKRLYKERQAAMNEQLARVQNGTRKMRETDEMIASMRVEIETKRPLLERASRETQIVVADLTTRQGKANEVQVEVRAQEEDAAVQQQQALAMASEAHARLAQAKPIIDKAKAALDTIQASDLNELRSFTNPPSAVLKTTQACMVMFDFHDFNGAWSGAMDWKGAREFLSFRPLLDMIRNYPTDHVKPAVLQRIQKFILDDEFTVEVCSMRGSQTCGSLCAWVHAVNEYSKVVKEVAPMRDAAATAQAHLAETNAKLEITQKQLREVENELAELQRNYEHSLKQKNDLEASLQICVSRLENAELLSDALKSEGERWNESITTFSQRLSKLPLEMLIASACVAYSGAFTPMFRKRLMQQWRAILSEAELETTCNNNTNSSSSSSSSSSMLIEILGDPIDCLNWRVNGLPSDETSTENAIIATLSTAPLRWPLLIDPQEQGLKWLVREYGQQMIGVGAKARSALKVIKFSEPNWMRTLEAQIRLGGVVIIDDVGEQIDPALEPLIARRLFSVDGISQQIQLTPQSGPIDYHPHFKLFMCTKLPNPHYLPEVSTRVALLNFTVTLDGLQEQMLGEVVAIAKREIEEEKNTIIQNIAMGQRKLKTIEETILERLKSSKGNILDDRDLINELKSAQYNAQVISASQVEANEKIAVISTARDKYLSAAQRAAILFFVLADISRVDPMYQYSLQFFMKLVRSQVELTQSKVTSSETDKKEEEYEQMHNITTQQHANATDETMYGHNEPHEEINTFHKNENNNSSSNSSSSNNNNSNSENNNDNSSNQLSLFLHEVINGLTETMYTQICRGLFNRDKTLLSFLIATSLQRHDNQISEFEWQYFIRATALISTDLADRPHELGWLSRLQWELAEALSRTVPKFNTLLDSLRRYPDEWRTFIQAEEPQTCRLPCGWDEQVTPFQHVLVIRCFREEKMCLMISKYITETLGQYYLQPPLFDLRRVLDDSTPGTPVIFVLSQGADPLDALQSFAIAESRELKYVSLGQGQGENAKKLIAQCRVSGSWALLQNCHLSKGFMPELEHEVANLQEAQEIIHNNNALSLSEQQQQQRGHGEQRKSSHSHSLSLTAQQKNVFVHPSFRLWLTSMPSDFFPMFVLQSSIKVTNEPPTGLRANITRCFNDITSEEFSVFDNSSLEQRSHMNKSAAFKKLLYGLCFFHSVILERKKFGPLGWNVRYEWNDTDFHVSKEWLRLFFEEQEAIPWEALEYIIGQINYGGRVTDPQDRATLQTILQQYICANILDESYKFSESGQYYAPAAHCSLSEVKEHISAMSFIDEPEVFGMHTNASLRYQLQTSHYLLNTIIGVQPRTTGSASASTASATSPEQEVQNKCKEFEMSLPALITRLEAGSNSFTTLSNGLPNSMSTVLAHEMVKYNQLLEKIQHTLTDMQKALKGLTVLSSELDAMYMSFLTDQVPQVWAAIAYPSLKPLGAWYRDLLERVAFIRSWVQHGEPITFWIGGFYNPSAFMTGVYQAFARAEGVSVDKLGFHFNVVEYAEDEIDTPPNRGCYVSGIFADSWRWSRSKRVMVDALPNEPYNRLPLVHFLPEPHHKRDDHCHPVPLYRTTVRAGVISSLGASSNYVLSVEIPSLEDSSYWFLRGVACVCALDN